MPDDRVLGVSRRKPCGDATRVASGGVEVLREILPGQLRRLSPRGEGSLATALEDPDPVLIFEHTALQGERGPLPIEAGAVDLDRAAIRRGRARLRSEHATQAGPGRRSCSR